MIKRVKIFPRLSVVFFLQVSSSCSLVWVCDLSCHLTAILLLLCFRCHTGPIRINEKEGESIGHKLKKEKFQKYNLWTCYLHFLKVSLSPGIWSGICSLTLQFMLRQKRWLCKLHLCYSIIIAFFCYYW